MEQSFHPPPAAAERAAFRSARRFARAEVAPALPEVARSGECSATELPKEEELRAAWSRASIPRMAAAERAALRSACGFKGVAVFAVFDDPPLSGEFGAKFVRFRPIFRGAGLPAGIGQRLDRRWNLGGLLGGVFG
jgi:hypothetical protein